MVPFDDTGVFGPRTIAILSRAHREACCELARARPEAAKDEEVRHRLGRRLFEVARTGERDPHRLVAYALRNLRFG